MATVQHPNAMALSVKRVSISEDRWTESISCISIVPKQSTLNVEGKLFASYIHSNTKHRQWVPFHRINHPYFVRYQMWQKKIDATSTLESKSYKYVYSQTRQQHNGLINDKSTAIRWTKFIFFFFLSSRSTNRWAWRARDVSMDFYWQRKICNQHPSFFILLSSFSTKFAWFYYAKF